MNADGSGMQKVISSSVLSLMSVSPDKQWIIAAEPVDAKTHQTVVAYPTRGGTPRILCRACRIGTLEPTSPYMSWSQDQKAMYMSFDKTTVIPLSRDAFPKGMPDDLTDYKALLRITGARLLDVVDVFPGPTAKTYAFRRLSTQRNIYRIRLP